jgi:hypothetical protein
MRLLRMFHCLMNSAGVTISNLSLRLFDEPQLEDLTIETAPSAAGAADEVANQDVGIQYDANPLLTFWQDASSLEHE